MLAYLVQAPFANYDHDGTLVSPWDMSRAWSFTSGGWKKEVGTGKKEILNVGLAPEKFLITAVRCPAKRELLEQILVATFLAA